MTNKSFVTVERDGDAYDVTVWNAAGDGFVVEAVADEDDAKRVAEQITAAFRSWQPDFEQMLVTLDDRRQVGLLPDNEVHVRTSPGACWDVPLELSSHPHESNTVYFGEW